MLPPIVNVAANHTSLSLEGPEVFGTRVNNAREAKHGRIGRRAQKRLTEPDATDHTLVLRIEMRFWTLHCRLGYQDCFGWEAGLGACCCTVEEAKWQRDWECWDYFWGRSVSRLSACWNQNCLGVGLQEVAMVAGSLSVGWKDFVESPD